MKCGEEPLLLIDVVGLYYSRHYLTSSINQSAWLELLSELQTRKVGVLLDGRSREECKEYRENELDVEYVEEVTSLLFPPQLFLPSVVWFVKHDPCEFSCVDKHEVYSDVCKCRGEDWFLIATCNCDDLREGVDERKLPCYGNCVRFAKCILLIACPVSGRQ